MRTSAVATHRERPALAEWGFAWAVITVAVLVAYAPVTVGSESFYHHDRYFLHVPFWRAAWDALAAGHFPFWVHGIRAGYPLFANGEASLLYPFTYLFGPFFSAHRALDLFTLFHLVLGGGFCWMYFRQLTQRSLLPLVGALAFALSGRSCGLTIWGHAVAAAAYLPLLLWAIDRKHLVGMAVAIGLGALTGRPQVHVLTLSIGASYAALRIVQEWRGSGRWPTHRIIAVAAATALGVCLGAAQLIPTLELIGESPRSGGTQFAEWQKFALGTSHLMEMLVPGAYPGGWPEASSYPTLFVYVGIGLGVFQLFRVREKAKTDTLFWLALAVVSMYVAFGAPGAYTLSQELPWIRSFRVPARFSQVAAFALLVVAFLAWRQSLPSGRWPWVLLAVVLLDGTITALVGRHTVFASAYEQPQSYVTELQASARDETGSLRRYFCDSAWVEPADLANQTIATVEQMFAAIPPSRNLALQFRLSSVQGFGEPTYYWFPPDRNLISPGLFQQFGTGLLILRHPVSHPLLEVLPSKLEGFRAYRLRSPLPRAQVVYTVRRVEDWEAAYDAASDPNFDSRAVAVVEQDLAVDPVQPGASGSVRLQSQLPNRVVWNVDSTQRGFLVLFDTWAPGWTARVNGVDEPVLRANGVFRLVGVPAGRSVVEFRFAPPGLGLGVTLGVLALFGLVWITIRDTRRARMFARDSIVPSDSSVAN